jgi:hypothetical protein
VHLSRDAEKKLDFSFDDDDSGSKKRRRYGGVYGGDAFGDSLKSGGQFWVGACGRTLTSVAVKMVSHLQRHFISFVLSVRF